MRKNNTEHISDVLRQFLKLNRLDGPLYEKQLIESWPIVLGDSIMKYTTNLSIRKKILYVSLSSSVLRHDLYLSKTKIMESLNNHVGVPVIIDIVFK
jgi:hypothetical protein